jgi:NADP-dependent 3-hydroxy acid dehydrogenase YdfG
MTDKTIAITGATSGIGRATAEQFASNGYTTVLNARTESDLNDLRDDLPGDNHRIIAGDIGDENTSKVIKTVVDDIGGVDVLFNNAGYGVMKTVDEMTKDEFENQFNTNVTGVFLATKHLLPVFRDQDHGSIITTGSLAAKNTFSHGSAYAATKHAVQGFMGCLKDELRDTHVKCASVLPGSVDTSFFDDLPFGPTEDRHLDAEDVAKTVWFIANQPESADLDEIVLRPAKRQAKD